MNKAQIVQMAQQVGFNSRKITDYFMLEEFAQLAADHALEEAAKACKARAKDAPAPLAAECLLCAVAIRAMKGKP